MPSVFKVWIHIEEINEDEGVYEEYEEPESLATFSSVAEACTFRDAIVAANEIGDQTDGQSTEQPSGEGTTEDV